MYAWLLLVSGYATRVPFLWAALPPAAVGVVERLAFDSTYFTGLLQSHFLGAADGGSANASVMTLDMLEANPLGHFLSSPALWVALALTGVFLLGAVRLRRTRGAI